MDKAFVNQKLNSALMYLAQLEKVKFDKESLKDNIDTQAKVFFLYQNVIERCLGLAMYIVRFKKLGVPKNASETFLLLSQDNIIDSDSSKRLSGAYGFRNILIHEYDNIDYEDIVEEHNHNIENLKSYLKQIAEYIRHIENE